MTGTYKRFDQIDADFFRRLILGEDEAPAAPAQNNTGLMAPATPTIQRQPSSTLTQEPRRIDATPALEESILSTVAQNMARNTDNRQQLADAVVPQAPRMDQPVDLEEWSSLPPLEQVIGGDTTRAALGSAPDPVNLEGSTRGATPVSQQQEPSVEEAPVEPATEESAFSSVTNNLYEAFTVGGQEGTEAHVGLDSQNITLPAGIVADGLVYNGQTINAGQNTIPASSFDRSLLDTSGAYKTIGTGDNAVTIRRSDYNSDQDFSRAVIAEFENRARTAAGDNWNNIPQDAQEALVKVGWNLGPGWYSGSSARTLYEELSSDTPDVSRINSSILRASTVRGGGASIGIAKARADAYNAARDAFNGAEITRIEADNTGTNTAFKYYDAEGNLVHTEQTNRAVGLYENTQTEISKNSSGEW